MPPVTVRIGILPRLDDVDEVFEVAWIAGDPVES